MRGYHLEQAKDVDGVTFTRGAIVVNRSDRGQWDPDGKRIVGRTELKVLWIVRTPSGAEKISYRSLNGMRRAAMYAKNVRVIRSAEQEKNRRANEMQSITQSNLTVTPKEEHTGGATLIIRRATPAPAPAPIAPAKPKLDAPMVNRWTVRLWQGEAIDLFEVVDTRTGEVVESFSSRDMAHDAAREMNFLK
jgi:hypothetical protein